MVVTLIIGFTVVLVIGVIAIRAYRRKVTTRRVEALYQAAAAGDRDRLRQWVDQGHSIDMRDNEGNTALHFAYYGGQQDAIDALVAYGADDNLHNNEGLSPVEMGVVATIETQLNEGVGCLSRTGSWLDKEQGRAIYNQLKRHNPRIFNPALVRCVLTSQDLRKLLHLAIKLGIRGSEDRLAQVLHGYGTTDMAVDYLNVDPGCCVKQPRRGPDATTTASCTRAAMPRRPGADSEIDVGESPAVRGTGLTKGTSALGPAA